MNAVVRAQEVRSPWDIFDGVVDGLFRPVSRYSQRGGQALAPAIDVIEKDGEYLVRAELPGVKKEDLDVSIQDGVLTINAQSKYENEEKKDGRVIRQERHYGKYVRSMRLGEVIDDKNIKAEYKDGILELVLSKAEEVKPKKIDVEVH
ncbi:MAG: Hsp20/alpha crystallin family protein [Gammaproteobacteria bacterium]|nr:Hsp20/alpha crystallin family protein [Gammaproteobacteria bacterium]